VVEIEEPFAADHRVEALRGKVAKMRVTLKSLKTRQLPPVEDALAKSLGIEGVDTLDQLRERIRTDLTKREQRRAESELRDALVKGALAKNEFEVPPALVERAIDAMIEGAAERFARQGIDIRQLGLDQARMRGDLREQALLQVRGRLLLESIADAEKIEVTDEDLQAEITRLAGELGLPLAQAQQQMRSAQARDALKSKIREDKAMSVLSSAATIQDA
jgi:trigger factor